MPSVRDVADNAWLLLVSRLAAGLSIPVIVGAFIYVWEDNAADAVIETTVERHEFQIQRNSDRITARETNAFTQADAAAMEARLVSQDDRVLEELRALRQELAADRRRTP